MESSAGLATGGRSERSRLLVLRLAGVASGVVCWSLETGGRIERSRLLVWRQVDAAS